MRPLLFAFFLAAGLLSSHALFASHIIGAEISYTYLGGNKYRIILDVYRDCYYGEAPFDSPAHITIRNDAGVFVNNLNLQPLYTDTIPNNIANDPCLFPPDDVCVEHARYEGTATLNGPGGFYFIYQRCCRNQTISNIYEPDETGSTYFVYLSPTARALANSSPRFGFYPPVFVCVNEPIEHPHAATDAEADSLVYKFYTPFKGASITSPQPPFASAPPYDTVIWVNPLYNLSQLLGPSPEPLTINSQTGLITGLPKLNGQYVVGIVVEEYRNGQLLSVVRRDYQYNVGPCAELNVQIEAPDAQCDNLTVTFGNPTQVAQNFIWYYDWPNPSPSSTVKAPTFTFPDTGTYTVALVAEPVGQCVDTAFQTIFLQYNSLTPDFSLQTYDCTDTTVLVLRDLSTDDVSPPNEWHWTVTYGNTTLTSNQQHPIFVIPNPSSGTVTLRVLSENGCDQTKTANFTTGGNNPVDLLPPNVDVCIGSSAQLNPNGPTFGFTYQWSSPVPANQQNLVNPTVTPSQTTTYHVVINGFNGLCQSEADVKVTVFPTATVNFEPDTDCDARIVHFDNTTANNPFGYVWDFGDPTNNGDQSTAAEPTYTYPDYGAFNVTLMTSPNAVCKDTIVKPVTISEKLLSAAFDFDYTNCEEDGVTIQFSDVSINNQLNTVKWSWVFSGVYNGTSQVASPVITVTQEGTLTVSLTITTDEDCVSATTPRSLQIDLTEIPNMPDDGDQVLGCLTDGVTLNPNGNPNYIYNWSPATGLSCNDCPSPHANPSQTTVYTVQVLNLSADTCDITRSFTVFVPTNVGLVASNDVRTCEESVLLSASTFLTPVTYAWFDDAGVQVAGNTATTNVPVSGWSDWIVRATDQFGCHYFDTVQVAGGPVDIGVDSVIIKCSNEPVDVFAQNLDLNDTLTYQWTPANAFNPPTNIANPDLIQFTGEQWVFVEAVNQFGCEEWDTVYVAVLDVNNMLDFGSLRECNDSVVHFINQSVNAFNYTWDFGDPNSTTDVSDETNPTYVYSEPGAYEVTLSLDFNLNCFTDITKTIVIDVPVFETDFDFEYVACDTDFVDVQFHDATLTNLNGPNQWQWTTNIGQSSAEPSPVFTVPAGAEFVISLSNSNNNGCADDTTKTIKLDFIEVSFPNSLVLCQGDTASLNPAGNTGYLYHWRPNVAISDPNSPNPQVWPTTTTTYTVDITSFSPDTCIITTTITVFVPQPKIDVEASNDTYTCGAPVTLSANSNIPSTNYVWTVAGVGVVGTGPTLTDLPSSDTEYEVKGTDQYGCADSATVFVRNEAVQIDLPGASTACPSVEIDLSVTNYVADHNLDYAWTVNPSNLLLTPGNLATVSVLTPEPGQTATYEVIATNQDNCKDTLGLTLVGQTFVPTVVDSLRVCPGVTTALNPGADPNLTYNWSPINSTDPNPVVTITNSTTYTVTISDAFGSEECEEVFEVLAWVPPVIELDETIDTFTCGKPLVISAISNVPTTIQWTDPQGAGLGTGPSLTVNPATMTTQTYIATATDPYQCFEQDTIVVANYQTDLALQGGGVIDTCPMPSYNICVTNLDPFDVLTFEWTASNGGTILSGDDTTCPFVTAQQGVTATFTATVTNQWGCSEVADFQVTTHLFDPVLQQAPVICPGVPTPINPQGNPQLQYAWSPQTGLSCYDCPNPTATLFSNQTYTVTVEGFNGDDICSRTQTVNVLVNPLIELATDPADSSAICSPTAFTFTATTSSNIVTEYLWSQNPDFSNPIGNTNQVSVVAMGTETYYVLAADTLGCKDTARVDIFAYPINVSLDDRFNYCVESSPLTITAVNNAPSQVLTYTWSPAEYIVSVSPDGSTVQVEVPDTALIFVEMENQYGCITTDSATLIYFDIFPTVGEISSSEDTILFNSGEFSQLEIDFFTTYTYDWEPAEGLDNPNIHNPKASPDETTTYTVLITNEGGCVVEKEVTIVVLNPDCQEPYIFLPNAFTPNGDGENDVLYVRSNIVESLELVIYNRWGQKVFETTNQETGWDGTFKNTLQTPDVFAYYLKAKCFNGQEFFKKGNVTLLR